jgi:hypothetical protein
MPLLNYGVRPTDTTTVSANGIVMGGNGKVLHDNITNNRVPPPVCHTGARHAMRIGNSNIWAGGFRDLSPIYEDLDLIIRAGDRFDYYMDMPQGVVELSPEAKAMLGDELTVRKVPPVINIEWYDYDVPQLDREWWVKLYTKIKMLNRKDGKLLNIGIHCQGGHGRTGTIVSILKGLDPKFKGDPVKAMRVKYCTDIIETMSQIEYVEAITGHQVYEGPKRLLLPEVKSKDPWDDGKDNLYMSSYRDQDNVLFVWDDGQQKYREATEEESERLSPNK